MQDSNRRAEDGGISPRYLGDRLLARIQDLVDGNHVRGSEISESRLRHCECAVSVDVSWKFEGRYSEETVVGDASVRGAHFWDNRSAFVNELELRLHQARHNLALRKSFQEKVLAQNGGSLGWAHQEQLVWDFGQHSYCYLCGACHGEKVVNCQRCLGRGKVSCYQCHGNRWVWQFRTGLNIQGQPVSEQYKHKCDTCSATGTLNCSSCHSSGQIRCDECSGNGFFTLLAHTSAVAIPSINFGVNSELQRNALQSYLSQIGSQQAARLLNFSVHQNSTIQSQWIVQYACISTVIEQSLHLRGKDYLAAAIGSGVVPFIRPPLFDDIFVEELQDLRSVYSNQKSSGINKRGAVNFFKKYSGQPVLDRALQLVARLSADDRKYPGDAVNQACDGYITKSAAAALGRCMADLLDKVSPAYSIFAWMLVMSLPLLYQLLSIEHTLELTRGSFWESTGTFLLTFLFGILFLIFVSPVAWFFSSIHSAVQRQFVPKPYRQRARNWEPFSLILAIYFLLTFIGVIYGLSARFDYVPKWNGIPINYIQNGAEKQFNGFIENFPWLKERMPSFFHLNEKKITADSLNSIGFPGSIDGTECQSVWRSYSQIPEGPHKEKWRRFYEIEYGSLNFNASCVGSARKRKCEIVREFEKLPQGAEKEKLRQYLGKENFKKPLFDRKMCH